MLDNIAKQQAEAAQLRPLLQGVADGKLTRRGYVVFTLLWDGPRAAPADIKRKAREASEAGLITWGCATGPRVVATLTDKGREVLG
jgi:hypothetical protein